VVDPTTIAVDLAKSVFEVAVSSEPGRVCLRKRLTRGQMAAFFASRPPSTVLMEACGTAHFWGRRHSRLGHTCWMFCSTRRSSPVPVKDVWQQAMAGLHRIRSGWIATRTARLNTVTIAFATPPQISINRANPTTPPATPALPLVAWRSPETHVRPLVDSLDADSNCNRGAGHRVRVMRI